MKGDRGLSLLFSFVCGFCVFKVGSEITFVFIKLDMSGFDVRLGFKLVLPCREPDLTL